MAFFPSGKLWIVIIIIYLLDIIGLIDGQASITKSGKRRYKLIPFYDDDIKISDPNKPALIQDLSLLSYVLNNTADTVFGSKDAVRDLLTFFADLNQIMIQWLFLFLICSSFFHTAACACIGCCACYVFKNEIRNTLKFAKRQSKSFDQPPVFNDERGRGSSSTPAPPQVSATANTCRSNRWKME
ncbi:Basement membrane-specific heparan sulfate proteoglycan core protein [Dirofilaria immitis]